MSSHVVPSDYDNPNSVNTGQPDSHQQVMLVGQRLQVTMLGLNKTLGQLCRWDQNSLVRSYDDYGSLKDREQLELEVRKQVEAAMVSQRGLVDENQSEQLRAVKWFMAILGPHLASQSWNLEYPTAIQQDFQDTAVNPGVKLDFLILPRYPAAILQDAQAMMISDLVKRVDYMEAWRVILQDLWDTAEGSVRELTKVTVNVGNFEYKTAIQQDFQAGENEVGLKDDRPKLDEGLVASPMEALLKGMSQLHQAMTLQLDRQSNKPEAIRPGITGSELPKLPEADEYAAINVGDWLHGLTGPMGDLTDGSGGWWADVMRSLDDYYKEYLAAATVRKVQLKAEDFARPGVKEERWSRVDKRAASMLLQAVPEAIKSELMANRLSTTLAILGRILTIYRPGSSVERQQVLKALESPGVGGSPMDLVEILRKWARWLKRAEDLGLQPPDASILLKGLDVATKPLMEKNNEILFRTNMLRFSLDLDAAPTKTAVLRFHGHLLAEFEQLAYRGRGKGGPTVAAAVRAANAVADAGKDAIKLIAAGKIKIRRLISAIPTLEHSVSRHGPLPENLPVVSAELFAICKSVVRSENVWFLMANKEHRCGSSKDAPREPDADDLALPGEEMENDENLRLEVNIDREAWNRHITTNHGFNIRYSVFKNRYQQKWKFCLPFRPQSEFAECNQCFDIKQEIKAEKDLCKKFGLIRDYKDHLRAVGFDRELEQHLEGLDPHSSDVLSRSIEDIMEHCDSKGLRRPVELICWAARTAPGFALA
ncbi:hypothetical protein AK812_SmicGene6632 [Symbiodinium microadriaticum]|uniref:Uncharacterized protein n=1 Tax=Symbiodinium microadriaticum TaxID=2951 RepID=A0A1Q9EQM2_SYMMI|nr:hypothetical protein AK812_SmicGene6632 [Symbiodinium microadriaticum]